MQHCKNRMKWKSAYVAAKSHDTISPAAKG